MVRSKIFVIFVLTTAFFGCNETVIKYNGSGQNNTFSIPVWDYSDNHYFLDTIYKTSFLAVMNDSSGILPQSVLLNKVKYDLPSFQIWVQCENTIPLNKTATAWIFLPEKPSNGYDSVKFRRTDCIMDSCFYGYFRELNPSEYYIDPMAGFIGLKIDIPEDYCIGVTYETYEGKKFGEGKYDVNFNQSMVLKMIKCINQSPDYTPRAWKLKMKNVYRLPFNNISNANFKLDVFLKNNSSYLLNIPGQKLTLSQMLLIDRYSENVRKWNPDGLFDWIPNRTVIPETGDIIFPTLYPFRDELRKFISDTNLIFSEIYSERKTSTQYSTKSNFYFIRGYTDTLK